MFLTFERPKRAVDVAQELPRARTASPVEDEPQRILV
jgi:hypothetical protein